MTDSEAMICSIFKGSREPELYVYVPFTKAESNIPEELRQRLGKLKEVMTLEITPDKKLARVDAVKVLKEIREQGYFVQLPPVITGQVLFDGD